MAVEEMKVRDDTQSDQGYPRLLLTSKTPRKSRPNSGVSEEKGGSIGHRASRGRFFPGGGRTMHILRWMPSALSV